VQIPLCDLRQQYLALKDEIDAAIERVAEEGTYILGPNVAALEREIAEYCQCTYAVGVNSGTDALHLALRALDIGPGDEVITTPFSFIATSAAIRMVGAKPVFVDISPRTYLLDVDRLEDAITPHTKAILPVHLFGQPCDMNRVMEIARKHGLAVIEDCAQAIGATYHGRKVGTFGNAGCLSFFPSKNLGCFGDGGMLVTNDVRLFERAESLRRHGSKAKYYHDELGLNSRLDEMQAAILRLKLPHLDRWNALRRQHAYAYNRLLAQIPAIECPAEFSNDGTAVPTAIAATTDSPIHHVYHQYTIAADNRDKILARLVEQQIGCAVYYPQPLHLQKANADLHLSRGCFPVAECAANRCLSLPMFPELSIDQLQRVVDRVNEIVSAIGPSALAA
jgi:dTDP-4-amino-4,6-dideoxygalactose transaminase